MKASPTIDACRAINNRLLLCYYISKRSNSRWWWINRTHCPERRRVAAATAEERRTNVLWGHYIDITKVPSRSAQLVVQQRCYKLSWAPLSRGTEQLVSQQKADKTAFLHFNACHRYSPFRLLAIAVVVLSRRRR